MSARILWVSPQKAAVSWVVRHLTAMHGRKFTFKQLHIFRLDVRRKHLCGLIGVQIIVSSWAHVSEQLLRLLCRRCSKILLMHDQAIQPTQACTKFNHEQLTDTISSKLSYVLRLACWCCPK